MRRLSWEESSAAGDRLRAEGWGGLDPTYGGPCVRCETTFYARNPYAKYCSRRCRNDAYIERRRKRKEQERRKVCRECEESFQATRTDAKYCSGACRQRAYRARRVTDASCGESGQTDTRNGVTAECCGINSATGKRNEYAEMVA